MRFSSDLRLEDALEFLESAKENLEKKRFKASVGHSVDSCISANDAFTLKHLDKRATKSHFEAIDLHKEAAKKMGSDKSHLLRQLLNTRHDFLYNPRVATKEDAEINLKKAVDFIGWVQENLK